MDLKRKVLTVSKAEWHGVVSAPKSGRSRKVPMTEGLAQALADHRHLHADLTMTKRYMHLSPGAREESAEAVQEAEKRAVDGDRTETAGLQLVKPSRSEVL